MKGIFMGQVCVGAARFIGACIYALYAVLISLTIYVSPASSGGSDLNQGPTPICEIQGGYWSSPFDGKTVTLRGVVTLDLDETSRRGFFLQQEGCDSNSATSDGLFVYLGQAMDVVRTGDLVEVRGLVQEYYAMTEVSALPGEVAILSRDNPLPLAVVLNPPFANDLSSSYFESLEGMRVELPDALVVGPTSASDESFVVRADLGFQRVFRDDPAGTGEIVCVDDGGLAEIAPEVKVGDRVEGLVGVIDYSLGLYRLQLSASPSVYPALTGREAVSPLASSLDVVRAASFNLADLFDTFDDPLKDDTLLSAAEYRRRLAKRALAVHQSLGEPDLIAVQEVENEMVLKDLLARPEIESQYDFVWVDSADSRGIDLALLYRPDRFALLDYQAYQGCTTLLDGLGPDGNRDMSAPYNAPTCDSDGDGSLEGNRLFSRPPLAVRLALSQEGDEPLEITVLVNHWKSKIEDTSYAEYTLPRRMKQAQFTAGIVEQLQALHPGASMLLLGDLNDYSDSSPLAVMQAAGLRDLTSRITPSQRYTYVHQGVSQVLDYALLDLRPPLGVSTIEPVHINADYPYVFSGVADVVYRSSDHDPLLLELRVFSHFDYLPLVSRD
jgi:predicted extracellular nuclease